MLGQQLNGIEFLSVVQLWFTVRSSHSPSDDLPLDLCHKRYSVALALALGHVPRLPLGPFIHIDRLQVCVWNDAAVCGPPAFGVYLPDASGITMVCVAYQEHFYCESDWGVLLPVYGPAPDRAHGMSRAAASAAAATKTGSEFRRCSSRQDSTNLMACSSVVRIACSMMSSTSHWSSRV